jgi:hypothetical protein
LDWAIIATYAAAKVKGDDADRRLAQATSALRGALACAPTQAFLWYALAWTAQAAGAEPRQAARFLEQSYALGPDESWISFYRAEDALSLYDELRPTAQARVRAEFIKLVRDFPNVAARVLHSADQNARERLLAWAAVSPLSGLRALAVSLDARGLLIDVPGVEYRSGRIAQQPKHGSSDGLNGETSHDTRDADWFGYSHSFGLRRSFDYPGPR